MRGDARFIPSQGAGRGVPGPENAAPRGEPAWRNRRGPGDRAGRFTPSRGAGRGRPGPKNAVPRGEPAWRDRRGPGDRADRFNPPRGAGLGVPENETAVPQSETGQPAFAEAGPVNILYGRNPVREALKAGRDIEKLMVARGDLSGSAREIIATAQAAGVNVQFVDRGRLDEIAYGHQGIVAFASAYPYASIDEVLEFAKERGEAPFLVILDKVTDPQNLGAIVRTAACAGAHGVVVQLHRAVGLTPAAVKASAGAVEHVKVARVVNINQTIRDLKGKGIWVYAADPSGADYRTVRFEGPCALVIGSESEGISPLTLQNSDHVVSIPMRGPMDSLNASVAAAILMYAVFSGR